MKLIQIFALIAAQVALPVLATAAKPNVVIILADDFGYGDARCYNPQSKLATPHLDRLAAEGIRFTDAHTPSSVCTPTRYALMTGRYAWRTWLKTGVLDGFDPPLIDVRRPTLASFLKAQGYTTACIGKWHLGMQWTAKNGEPVPFRGTGNGGFRAGADVDFTRELTGGPLDRGFDHYFGISASLDMSPYVFIEGRRPLAPATEATTAERGMFLNQVAGMTSPGFTLESVLPSIIDRGVQFIDEQAQKDAPFFLYLPLNSPHLPVVPNEAWRGTSGIGLYGDFVAETDAGIGRILDALDRNGASQNTLVVFTSDNGGLWHQWEPRETDDIAGYKPTPRALYNAQHGHHSNMHLRGTKADIYEGGHRVPFILRWPGQVRPGTEGTALIELNDVFATLAEIIGVSMPADGAEDSFSFQPVLAGSPGRPSRRAFAVHHTNRGAFALREGRWKLMPARGSGGFSTPRTLQPAAGEPAGQLYDLERDPRETRNVWLENPDVVQRMQRELESIQNSERTRYH